MKLVSITLEGFRSFRDEEWVDLSNITLAAITGANHSGKTSILRGIEYALFGAARGDNTTLVHRGSAGMRAVLECDIDGEPYTIIRSHKAAGTGHKVTVMRGEEIISAKDLATTQTLINELVGMDRDVSRATWMAMQGDIDALCLMDGPARRAVFTKAFRLDRFTRLLDEAKLRRRDNQRDLDHLRGQLQGLETAVELDPDLEDWEEAELRADLAAHEAARERARRTTQVQDLKEHARDLRRQISATAKLADELPHVHDVLAQRQEALTGLEEALEDAAGRLADARARRKQLSQELERAQRKLAHAEDTATGDCDTCGQELTDEARGYMIDGYQLAVTTLHAALDDLEETLEERAGQATQARSARDEQNSRVRSAQQKLAQCEQAASSHDTFQARLESVQQKLDRLHGQDATEPATEPVLGEAQVRRELELRATIERNHQRADRLRRELDTKTALAGQLEALVAAWSPSGIPMTMLRGVAGEVADDANRILQDMESDLVLGIDTDGSGVNILVGDAEWSTLSGQERFFVSLALRLALGRAVARRSNTGIGTLLLDEGWGALDDDHAQRAISTLANLTTRDDGLSILTVTHQDTVGGQTPQRIEVTADTGTSRAARL